MGLLILIYVRKKDFLQTYFSQNCLLTNSVQIETKLELTVVQEKGNSLNQIQNK